MSANSLYSEDDFLFIKQFKIVNGKWQLPRFLHIRVEKSLQ